MSKRWLALLLALCMLLALMAGCGGTAASSAGSAPAEESAEASVSAEEEPEAQTAEEPESEASAEAEEPAEDAEASSAEEFEPAEDGDFTSSNAALDYGPYKEMLKGLTTELPIPDAGATLSYFFGFEGTTLNYVEGGTMEGHQVWKWLMENSGVNFELNVVNKTQETDQFNLLMASGDYPDIVPARDYSAGVEAAYEEDIYLERRSVSST